MNTKVWYLPYVEGVYHTRMIETYSNAHACMVRLVHTMRRDAHPKNVGGELNVIYCLCFIILVSA